MTNVNYLDNTEMLEEANEAVEFFSLQGELKGIEEYYSQNKNSEEEENTHSMKKIDTEYTNLLNRIIHGDYSAVNEAKEFARLYCLDSTLIDKAVEQFHREEYDRDMEEVNWWNEYIPDEDFYSLK